jgi:hypothetical protein
VNFPPHHNTAKLNFALKTLKVLKNYIFHIKLLLKIKEGSTESTLLHQKLAQVV